MKSEDLQDVVTGRELRDVLEQHDIPVEKVGSYLYAQGERGDRVYFPDSNSVMPKPLRESLLIAMKRVGLIALMTLLVLTLLLV